MKINLSEEFKVKLITFRRIFLIKKFLMRKVEPLPAIT